MKSISLKLPEDLLERSGKCAMELRMTRAAYVRTALDRMNHRVNKELRAKRLADVSRRVRIESLKVNAEFAAIEREPDA
jgi:predicted transcriptional regulator